MLPFRIREDARTWFRELRERDKSFKIDFDSFYFCFMAGIATGRKRAVPTDETGELVAYFPKEYEAQERIMIAIFLTRELKELGLETGERHKVHKAVAELVSARSLTDKGVGEFNKYAHGGFDVLQDWFDDKPRTIDTFLRTFKRKLGAHLAASAG